MHRRAPWTLWRSVTIELLRLAALAAAITVAVISFAAAIKPLADGKLEPANALKFILLAMPPMLAYALPFAGGFAATLVYHRMAQDNELTAAQAGGVSLRTLLLPAVATGLLLAGSLSLLNEIAIPRFLRGMQRLITMDLGKLMDLEISKGRSVQLPDSMQLYADAIFRRGPDAASGAMDQVSLSRPALLRTDDKGNVVSISAAQRADLWFFPPRGGAGTGDASSIIQFRLRGWRAQNPGERVMNLGTEDESEGDIVVPEMFRDSPKFLSFSELRRLRATPENIDRVDGPRRDLALALAEDQTLAMIRGALATNGAVRLADESSRDVVVRASKLEPDAGAWLLRPQAGKDQVEVELTRDLAPDSGSPAKRMLLTARGAKLHLTRAPTQSLARVRIDVALDHVRSRSADADDPGSERTALSLASLRLPAPPEEKLLPLSSASLLDTAARQPATAPSDQAASSLRRAISDLMNDITAKQHERMAIAASCLVIVLTGALSAVRLARSQPLTVYLWTFFPALACLVTISGGQQTVRTGAMLGLAVLWGGVLALGLYALMVYRTLARH